MRLKTAALVAVGLLVLTTSCADIEPPKVMLGGLEIEGMSVDGIELVLLADVRNPNDFGATIDELSYRISVDGTRLAEGLLSEDVDVEAGGVVRVGIPFTLTWEGVGDAVEKALDGKEHDWKLKGRGTLKKGVIAKTFTFDEGGSFQSPEAEDVEINF